MKFGINFNESSTLRGLVWIVGGFMALVFLSLNEDEKAVQTMSIIAAVAGGLGVLIQDKHFD